MKLEEYQSALDSFENALEMARLQDEKKAEQAIKTAINDVNSKIVKGMKEGEDDDEDDDKRSQKSDKDENGKRYVMVTVTMDSGN